MNKVEKKLKIKDILTFHSALMKVATDSSNVSTHFAYAVRRNIKAIDPIIETVKATLGESESGQYIKTFFASRDERIVPYIEFDYEGKPSIDPATNNFILKNAEGWASEYAKLISEFPDIQAHNDLFNAKSLELDNQEETITITTVSLDVFPATISFDLMEHLELMVTE